MVNVVIIVQTTSANRAGIIIKNFSLSLASPVMRQKVVQIIKFTIKEYLNEIDKSDFSFLALSYAILPPIHKAIKNEITNPIVEIP